MKNAGRQVFLTRLCGEELHTAPATVGVIFKETICFPSFGKLLREPYEDGLIHDLPTTSKEGTSDYTG